MAVQSAGEHRRLAGGRMDTCWQLKGQLAVRSGMGFPCPHASPWCLGKSTGSPFQPEFCHRLCDFADQFF